MKANNTSIPFDKTWMPLVSNASRALLAPCLLCPGSQQQTVFGTEYHEHAAATKLTVDAKYQLFNCKAPTPTIAFCIVSAVIFHNNFADQTQMILFMKNLAMAGGFLALSVSGAGALSVDARRS